MAAAKKKPAKKNWIQAADKKMDEKGTKGAFGKATPKKIEAAEKKGGVEKKRAVFAQNMKNIAAKKGEGKQKSSKRPRNKGRA